MFSPEMHWFSGRQRWYPFSSISQTLFVRRDVLTSTCVLLAQVRVYSRGIEAGLFHRMYLIFKKMALSLLSTEISFHTATRSVGGASIDCRSYHPEAWLCRLGSAVASSIPGGP